MRLVFCLFGLMALSACLEGAPEDGAGPSVAISDEIVKVSDDTVVAAEDGVAEDGVADDDAVAQVVINTDNPDISDTQDFAALSQRETIESDAARLKAQKEKFTVIAPTALPTRKKAGGANVVAYALESTNAVGEKIFKRFGFGGALSQNACKRYQLADDAQLAFLKAGGPKRDPKGLDPDGDGFACGWSPEDYRSALK